jgi:hypothetical protein
MSWWSKLLGRKPPAEASPVEQPPAEAHLVEQAPAEAPPVEQPPAAGESGPRASWIPADKNRFGVPVLDLISIIGNLMSTSSSSSIWWTARCRYSAIRSRPSTG